MEEHHAIRFCLHCARPYDWHRSSSWSLKLTFCSKTCEQARNTYSIEELLSAKPEHWLHEALREDWIREEAAKA